MIQRFSKIFSAPKEETPQSNLDESKNNQSDAQLQHRQTDIEQNGIHSMSTMRNVKKSKYERSMEEFVQSDQDSRNILHRAALEQNPKLIVDIIQEYKIVAQIDEYDDLLKNYVNKTDKYGTTALLMCCYINNTSFSDSQRLACLQTLYNYGGNINIQNPRTLWRPVHWISYYGDLESLKFLLKNNAIYFVADYQGYYPLDLAGKKEYKFLAKELIENLILLLDDYVKWKKYSRRCDDPARQKLIEEYQEDYDRHLNNPMLRVSIQFWICYFKFEKFDKIKAAYAYAPFFHYNSMNAVHIAAWKNNMPALKYFVEDQKKPKVEILALASDRNEYLGMPLSYQMNNIFSFNLFELNIYSSQYKSEVMKMNKWERNFLINYQMIHKKNKTILSDLLKLFSKKEIFNYLNETDFFGNTPLHLAALVNAKDIIKYLISEGASMEIENKELWQPIDLATDSEAYQIFLENMTQSTIRNKLLEIRNFLLNFDRILPVDIVNQRKIKFSSLMKNLPETQVTDNLIQLNKMCTDLLIPDYVIKCKLQRKEFMNRLNFQISLLQNAKFHVYLMQSEMDENIYYVMLRHSQEQLEVQALISKMEVKLIDSYDNEPFDINNKGQFEPFRSRQRQDVIEQHLNRIINMEEMRDAGIFDSYYRMHSFGGISKIRKSWIEKPKWYWPQPLNQLDDYLMEGKGQNFTSCTALRLYFGEKISFFFAWKSYLTCVLVAVAFPGIALQTYILLTDNFNTIFLPFWVIYLTLWSTISVEFWKRKTCEINARWGTLDLMNDIQQQEQQLKEGFSGDEEIYLVTGELTKHEQKTRTIIVFLISIPILFILLSLVIIIFLAIDQYNQAYAQDSDMQKIIVGVMQGASITILNLIYTTIAFWFVQKENHKYAQRYETSLIYKNVIFKFLNSYLAVGYSAFVKPNTSLKELFYLLLPVLVIKQVNYILLSVVAPSLLYRFQEKWYFRKLNEKMLKNTLYKNSKNYIENYKDPIEKIWSKVTKKELKCQPRTILEVYLDKSVIIHNMDADAVELNGLKSEADNNLVINYFMESMIDFGYISLFSAAFPIGPAISMVMNILEIRMKIITYLYVYRKPSAEKAAGIGDWLDIWEALSTFGIFSNFALLYLRQEKELREYFFPNSKIVTAQTSIWIFLLIVFFILVVKILIQKLIPDKPLWVFEDEESRKAERQNKMISEDYLKSKEKENEELYLKLNILESETKRLKKAIRQLKKSEVAEEKDKEQEQDIEIEQKTQLQRLFYKMDRILICERIDQIRQSNFQKNICSECNRQGGSLYCLECEQFFCKNCFDQFHQIQKLVHTTGECLEWCKFQQFAIPIVEQSAFFKDLKEAYNILYNYYKVDNKVTIYNSKIFQLFTTEDLFFINRIIYLNLKLQGKWKEFFKYCKILQKGTTQQKCLLMVDLIDENNDYNIHRREMNRFFISSLPHKPGKEIDNILYSIYGRNENMDKKDLTRKLLMLYETNLEVKYFLKAILQ